MLKCWAFFFFLLLGTCSNSLEMTSYKQTISDKSFFCRWTKFWMKMKTAFLHCIYLLLSLWPHPAMFTCRTSPEQKPGSVSVAAVARCFVDGRSQLCIVGVCRDRALMDWQWKWKETKWKQSKFLPFLWRLTGATVKIKEGRAKWDNGGLLREGQESPNRGCGAD